MTNTKKHFKSAEISTLSTDQTEMLIDKVGKERPHVVSAYKARLCSPTDFFYLCNSARFRVAVVALNTETEETKLFESDHITKKQRTATVSEIASIIGLGKKASRGLKVSHSFKASDVVESLGIEQNVVKPKRRGYSTGGITVDGTIHWIDTRKAGEEGWVVFFVLLDTDGGTVTWLDPNVESAQAEDICYALPADEPEDEHELAGFALPAGSPFSKFGIKRLSENALSVLGRLVMDSGESQYSKIMRFGASFGGLITSEIGLGLAYILSEGQGDFNGVDSIYLSTSNIATTRVIRDIVVEHLEEYSESLDISSDVIETQDTVQYCGIRIVFTNKAVDRTTISRVTERRVNDTDQSIKVKLKVASDNLYNELGASDMLLMLANLDEDLRIESTPSVIATIVENEEPCDDLNGFLIAGAASHIPCFSDIVDDLVEYGLEISPMPTKEMICGGSFMFKASGFQFVFTTSGNIDEFTVGKTVVDIVKLAKAELRTLQRDDVSPNEDLDFYGDGPQRPWYKKLCNFLTGKGWN